MRARVPGFMVSAVALSLAVLAVDFGKGPSASDRHARPFPVVVRTFHIARRSPCDQPAASAFRYGWPIKPFTRQHPIRGNFGDPRTLDESAPPATPRSRGSFSFHNGVDIAAPEGTPVYPVVSGTVVRERADEVIIRTRDGRTFQYWHLIPAVRLHQSVVAAVTVLGAIRAELDHVHLSEIDVFKIHNPVDPGHLEPYQDHTAPSIAGVFFHSRAGKRLDPERLRGSILITAQASDTPPLPVPGAWFDFPVTPALVSWRMITKAGSREVPWSTAVDFRDTEPANRDFWRVYAAGTEQNFPVFGNHFFWRRSGRYIFNLTQAPLDTSRLPNGDYILTVRAADACANYASLRESIRIRNR